MTLRKAVVLASALLCCGAFFAGGCGGEEASTDTTTVAAISTTTAAAGPTATTTVSEDSEVDGLEAYRAKMKEWRSGYEADFDEGVAVISAIEDPLTASEQDIQAMEDFADAIRGAAVSLKDMESSPELSSQHSAYVSALEDLAEGVGLLPQAMKDKSESGVSDAVVALSAATDKLDPARASLEQALGFALLGGNTSGTP